ncbi:MAG: peptidase penicillin amidase [Ferruginibacter sp.]|nr:peptidase penicillin amidase [Ferruginibacter sp.]
MTGTGKMDYEHFKQIKFDQRYPETLQFAYAIDSMMQLEANAYPLLKDVIQNLQQWDHSGSADSKGAAVFLLVYDYFAKKLSGVAPRPVTHAESVGAYQYVFDYMMQHFKRTDLVLGDIQKLVRGEDARPASGLPDVLAAAYTSPYKNGIVKITIGDAYICFVRYPKTGLPVIESVNTFGASSHADSPHYKDQMQLFQNHQTKHMTLDKNEVLQHAVKTYHPLK